MRCSECSREVRPVVAVDIDGTLGDFHRYFLVFAQAYVGGQLPDDYDGVESFREWWMRVSGHSERTWRDMKLAYRQGGLKRSMPPYEGAAELCNSVREQGAELWLTTTRPYLRLDNIDPDTREWLRRLGVEYDGLLYDEFKYRRLAELVDHERVVAVVDDLPEMIQHAAEQFGPEAPILRRTYWNRGYSNSSGFCEADGLADIQDIIHIRLHSWKEQHARARTIAE